jgi:eukaryotic-like serine/threonine-protein kinase
MGNPVGVPQTPPGSGSGDHAVAAGAPVSAREPAASEPKASPVKAKKAAASATEPAGTVSAVPPEPTPPAQSRTSLIVIGVLVILAIGAAIYFFTRGSEDAASGDTRGQLAPPTSAPPTTTSTTSTTPEREADAPAAHEPPPPTGSASASAAVAAATSGGDPTACVTASFSADSFDSSTSFSFLCSETDAPKLAPAVRAELVRARKNITDGMRDWALLGWYDLPAVVALRTRCCPSAKPLHLPEMALCTPVAGVLDAITSAAEKAADPTDRTLLAAVTAYTNDVYCIVRSGMGFRFGHRDNPEGGQDTTFLRFLGRFIKARPSR